MASMPLQVEELPGSDANLRSRQIPNNLSLLLDPAMPVVGATSQSHEAIHFLFVLNPFWVSVICKQKSWLSDPICKWDENIPTWLQALLLGINNSAHTAPGSLCSINGGCY